jgi:hypothetical protein
MEMIGTCRLRTQITYCCVRAIDGRLTQIFTRNVLCDAARTKGAHTIMPMTHAVLRFIVVILAFAAVRPVQAADGKPFEKIDQHTLAAPADVEESLSSLAMYLVKPCKTDREKARAAYRWITDRIAYDAEGFAAGRVPNNEATVVLRTRKAECEGFSNLFVAITKQMRLKALVVPGFLKDEDTDRLTDRDGHAWNAVQIDGRYALIDAALGAGYVDGKKFVKRFSEAYFLADPDLLLFSHFPESAKWQLVAKPLSKEQFEKQPKINRLCELVGAAALRAAVQERQFRGFAVAGIHPGANTRLQAGPLGKRLQDGNTYTFTLTSSDYTAIVIVSGKDQIRLTRSGETFSVSVRAVRGQMSLTGQIKDGGDLYTMIEYEVD